MRREEWSGYLGEFHGERPGITEDLLLRSRDRDGRDPYEWLAEAARPGAVLDLACGSAPLCARFAPDYIGLDTSGAELQRARRRCPDAHLVQADATTADSLLDAGAGTVLCSMSLQLLQPLQEVLAAVAGVLRPDGVLVATVPTTRPITPRDALVWASLLALLRSTLPYPNDAELRRLGPALAQAGLRLRGDERRRFAAPLQTADDADLVLDALYLPEVPDRRRARARRLLRGFARPGRRLGLPLRRVVATRPPM